MKSTWPKKRRVKAEMKKIEAKSLEGAYEAASHHFECSITELEVVVVQHPKRGFLGLMGQNAIIVAKRIDVIAEAVSEPVAPAPIVETPETSVTSQIDEDEQDAYYEDDYDDYTNEDSDAIVEDVREKINALFATICFKLDAIQVSMYDDMTLLIEFNGEDAALLIGKEGYRYKALSYMLFNWINAEYQLQIRLEIAEFLQNQEESVARYLVSVFENIDRDGHAQTRVLDGVLVQIALRQLRDRYHDKYVAIRTTRDGGKYIIINDYHGH